MRNSAGCNNAPRTPAQKQRSYFCHRQEVSSMSILLLVARWLLAVVFVVAALAKLADLRRSQKAMRDFGIPAPLAAPLGILLPFAELAITIALIVTPIALYGAIGALVLLGLFIIVISANLSLGRTPDCNCFGQLHSEPIGASTLIRNVILAVIAGLVVWQGAAYGNVGADTVALISTLSAFEVFVLIILIVLAAVVALEGWLLVQVMTQQGTMLTRIETLEGQAGIGETGQKPVIGLPEGEDAPDFALPDIFTGRIITLKDLLPSDNSKKPVALTFSSPNCGPCKAMIPDYVEWTKRYGHKVTMAMITQGTVEENVAKFAEFDEKPLVLLQQDMEVAQAYGVRGTPSAVAIRFDGSIHGEMAQGEGDIKILLTELTTDYSMPQTNPLLEPNRPTDGRAFPTPPEIGEPAPDLLMLDFQGNLHRLSDFRGSPTLLLFWNPGCEFCGMIKQDVLAWEKKTPKGAPQLVIVSTGGTAKDNDVGFRSLMIQDDTPSPFSILRWFKVPMTPGGILLDENGVVLAKAEGAIEVMELFKPVKRKGKLATV